MEQNEIRIKSKALRPLTIDDNEKVYELTDLYNKYTGRAVISLFEKEESEPYSVMEYGINDDGTATIFSLITESREIIFPSTVVDAEGKEYPVKIVSNIYPANCIGISLIGSRNTLKSAVFSEGIEIILGPLFPDYDSLLTVTFPSTLKFVYSLFWRCRNFEEQEGGLIQFTGTKEQWEALLKYTGIPFSSSEKEESRGIYTGSMDYTPYWDEDLFIRFCRPEDASLAAAEDYILSGECAKIRILNPTGEYVIPEYYIFDGKDYTISEIGTAACSNNDDLKTLTIPPSVRIIERDAFYACEQLEEIVIQDAEQPLSIGRGAFAKCKNLKKIYLGRSITFDRYAFAIEFNDENHTSIDTIIVRKGIEVQGNEEGNNGFFDTFNTL